jgi:hypothetical protein
LKPVDVGAPPAQLAPPPAASTVLPSDTVPALRWIDPPVVATSPRNVTLPSVADPLRAKSPPPDEAEFSLKVAFVNVAVAPLSRPPPDPATAVFNAIVTFVAVSVPPTLTMPAPFVAMLPSSSTSSSVAVPAFARPPPEVTMPVSRAMFPSISVPPTDAFVVNTAPVSLKTPPPVCVAVLASMAAKLIVIVPAWLKIPPPRSAEFSAIWTLVNDVETPA